MIAPSATAYAPLRPVIGLIGASLLLGACKKGDELEYDRFNGNDYVDVEVTASEILPAVSTDLRSNTGAVLVGLATVDPGGAPIGTSGEVTLEVGDAWAEDVELVVLRVDSGERGEETFDMLQDSADHAYWFLRLESLGDEGEVRTDRFYFELYVPGSGNIGLDTDQSQ